MEKCKNQQRSRINKAFKKIPRFDGTNPSYCFDWLEQTEALVNKHQGRIYREELLLNCGTSVSKTIHALPQGATNQNIKDAVFARSFCSHLGGVCFLLVVIVSLLFLLQLCQRSLLLWLCIYVL